MIYKSEKANSPRAVKQKFTYYLLLTRMPVPASHGILIISAPLLNLSHRIHIGVRARGQLRCPPCFGQFQAKISGNSALTLGKFKSVFLPECGENCGNKKATNTIFFGRFAPVVYFKFKNKRICSQKNDQPLSRRMSMRYIFVTLP